MTRPMFGDALDAASAGSSHYRDPVLAEPPAPHRFDGSKAGDLQKALGLAAVAALLFAVFYLTVLA